MSCIYNVNINTIELLLQFETNITELHLQSQTNNKSNETSNYFIYTETMHYKMIKVISKIIIQIIVPVHQNLKKYTWIYYKITLFNKSIENI